MRASHFFSKLLLSVLFLPAFLSAELINLENEAKRNDVHTQNNLEMSALDQHSNHSNERLKKNENIFASYRNNEDITIPAGGNVLFNVKNANKGDGIHYHDGVFTIKESGFYLINYGLASIGNAGTVGAAFGFNLVRTRHDHQTIVDSVLTNGSSAIVLFLKEHDKITVVSQEFLVTLVAGNLPPRTTSLTDTAHISFLKVNH